MWSPATWTWRAALTCVLLETVLHGVRGRWQTTWCFCNQSCVGRTHKNTSAKDLQRASVCSHKSACSHRLGSAGAALLLHIRAPTDWSFIHLMER